MEYSSATNALVQKYSLQFLTKKAELEVVSVNLQSDLHLNHPVCGFLQVCEIMEVDLTFLAS